MQIIPMRQAKILGLPRYYTGKPCPKNGHFSERRTINGQCLECEKEQAPLYYQANKEVRKAYDKQYYSENNEKCRKTRTKYRELNPNLSKEWIRLNLEHCKQLRLKWRSLNKKVLTALNAKRRISLLKRTPSWSNLKAIKSFYVNCPSGLEVDHILPLQGKLVSGLHVLNNLQYLTKSENSRKRHFFNPEKWGNHA